MPMTISVSDTPRCGGGSSADDGGRGKQASGTGQHGTARCRTCCSHGRSLPCAAGSVRPSYPADWSRSRTGFPQHASSRLRRRRRGGRRAAFGHASADEAWPPAAARCLSQLAQVAGDCSWRRSRPVIRSTLTGYPVSNGLFSPNCFAISRNGRNISWPSSRMQASASVCELAGESSLACSHSGSDLRCDSLSRVANPPTGPDCIDKTAQHVSANRSLLLRRGSLRLLHPAPVPHAHRLRRLERALQIEFLRHLAHRRKNLLAE